MKNIREGKHGELKIKRPAKAGLFNSRYASAGAVRSILKKTHYFQVGSQLLLAEDPGMQACSIRET